jgi:hypothetical protein
MWTFDEPTAHSLFHAESHRTDPSLLPRRAARLDFRHASGHLNQERPGYYLTLLRYELRHCSLSEQAAVLG